MKSWIKQGMAKHKQPPALAFVALTTQLKTAPSPCCSGPFDIDSEFCGYQQLVFSMHFTLD